MLKRYLTILGLGLVLAAAAPALGENHRRVPTRHIDGLDGPPTGVTDSSGNRWVAWSYRNGAEYDIAVCVLVDGRWSEPTLIETDNGRDEVEPTLAADARGNLYLAYSARRQPSVRLAVLPAGSSIWSAGVPLSAMGESATIPSLRIVDHKLIVAYRDRARLRIKSLPLSDLIGDDTLTITDGPDPIGKNHDK